MLSIENSPDPSCPSCNFSAVKSDERATTDPAALGGIPTPNFSIRGYVLASRSKNIAANWPFPQNSLQFCLKHGIKNLLPPFEPPGSVKARCFDKGIVQLQSEELENGDAPLDEAPQYIKSESCSPSNDLEEGNAIVNNDLLDDEVKQNIERNSAENTVVDRLLQISKGDSEASSVLEVVELPSLSKRPETSEKKCKVIVRVGPISGITRAEDLASTSSAVSDSMASKVCPVCKVFASTSNTTLNAHIDQCLSSDTNTNNVVTNLSKAKAKPRKKRLMTDIYTTAPHCTLKDLDRRNGTTWASDLSFVAPTSEINTEVKRPKVARLDIKDDENDGAVYVDSNGIKLRILSKFNDAPAVMPKENFKLRKYGKGLNDGKSYLICKKKRFGPKCMKMKMKPLFKKPSSLKHSSDEIQAESEEDSHEENREEKEESVSEKSDSENNVNGSESSSLRQWACSKRSDLSKKLVNGETDGNEVVDTDHPELVCADASNSVLKTKFMGIQASTDNVTDNGKVNSPTRKTIMRPKWSSEGSRSGNGLMLKLSRSVGTFVSSPRSKREEVCRSSSPKIHDLTTRGSKSGDRLLTSRKCSSSNGIVIKRPLFSSGANKVDEKEKHSILRKLRNRRSSMGTCGSLPSDASVSVRTNQTIQVHQSKSLDNGTWSEQGERSMKDEGKSKALVLVDSIDSVDDARDPVSRTVNGNSLTPASSAELEREPSCEVEPQVMSGTEVSLEQKTSGDEQDRRNQEDKYCSDQSNNCRIDASPIQESSACLSSHEDVGNEIPQEDSSITSNRMMSSDTDDLAMDQEPSGSPVSTASTISPSSPIGSKVNDFVLEPPANSVQGKLSLQQSDTLKMPPVSLIEGAEGAKAERMVEPAQLSEGQPCCCSRRENLPREPQFSRHPNLYIRPIIPSFGPVMDSPTGSISTMASSDSAPKFPTHNDLNSPSPTQSASKPVLRLMGKNLTVASKDEPVLLPSPVSDNASTPKCLSPLGFAVNNSVMYPESYFYHNPYHRRQQQQQHFVGNPVVFSQAAPVMNHQFPLHSYGMQVGGFARAPVPAQYCSIKTETSQAPCRTREVIVIDDSSDHESVQRSSNSAPSIPTPNPFSQRPFPCFPPTHSQLIPKELYGSYRPSFGVSSPRMSTIALPRGSAFQFPTPTSRPPMFYPETMR